MFTVLIKTKDRDQLVMGDHVQFEDGPGVSPGAGGAITVTDSTSPANDIRARSFSEGIAYVMNDKGKTIATYAMS